MVRKKARTIVSVADGAGGMMEVKDRRLEASFKFQSSENRRTGGQVVTLPRVGMPSTEAGLQCIHYWRQVKRKRCAALNMVLVHAREVSLNRRKVSPDIRL
jgi:hypothetical protein